MKLLALMVAVAFAASCATVLLLQTRTVEEHASVRVRIHYVGVHRCFIEVITATQTLTTAPARCVAVPHRAQP